MNGSKAGTSGSSGGSGSCPALMACGGDPTGDWTVDNVCVTEPQKLFAATINKAACSAALKSTSDIKGNGMYQLGADKNAMSTISVSGTAEFSFDDACVKALGIAQSASGECPKVEGEFTKQSAVKMAMCAPAGSTCDCTIKSELSFAGSGSYTTSNNHLMVRGLDQPYCVASDKLTLESVQSGSTLTFALTK